jgi:hypothetical protein
VLLARELILCLEFKTEDARYSRHAERQVEDYALDLRDFHQESRDRRIIPVAVAVEAESELPASAPKGWTDCVRPVQRANGVDLSAIISATFAAEATAGGSQIDGAGWDASAYNPVPGIVEAAEALFAGHDVREIAHSHAGATNLAATSDALIDIVRKAQLGRFKAVCFVTGVPGAGKTLAGLSLVHDPQLRREGRPAPVFLSGNGPLVKIVSAAISRDFRRRLRGEGGDRTVSTFIQNVHSFTREGLAKPDRPPVEQVVVFDEAQRAWDASQNNKKTGCTMSEPETMLSIMDRHADWAVVIALVGGGQEIHNGEAGLSEWGRTLSGRFRHWRVAVSPRALFGDASLAGHTLFGGEGGEGEHPAVQQEPSLHLEVCVRSFRARRVSEWVEAVLRGDAAGAAGILADLDEFPMALTRSLAKAKAWLRERTRGMRRCGLLASSGAIRLRADGLELSSGFRQGNRDLFVHWFLADTSDVRSSNQLEVAASEFECQGLELDWVGVCWGGDLAFEGRGTGWCYGTFSGNSWRQVGKEVDRRYLLNTYRVLLTRAREGLVVWVPEGDASDVTRSPQPFESTAAYLTRCGLKEI